MGGRKGAHSARKKSQPQWTCKILHLPIKGMLWNKPSFISSSFRIEQFYFKTK